MIYHLINSFNVNIQIIDKRNIKLKYGIKILIIRSNYKLIMCISIEYIYKMGKFKCFSNSISIFVEVLGEIKSQYIQIN